MATREITVNGNTYNDGPYDAGTNPLGLANGGHRQNNNLINMLLDVLADASAPLLDTSTTSMTIGTGSKTPTLADNRPIAEGVYVYMIDADDPTNTMYGNVTDHTGAVLAVNVILTSGSGTHASWLIQPAGPRGAAGADYTANTSLNALSALTPAANRLPLFNSNNSAQLGTFTSTGLGLLSSSDGPAALTLIGGLGQGTHSLPIPGVAFTANTTSGAEFNAAETTTNKLMVNGYLFDQSTAEKADISIPMPDNWDGGTITASIYWETAISGTNAVVWKVSALSLGDSDTVDTAYGTAQSVTDASNGANKRNITAFTSAITPSGTPAAGEELRIRVERDAANGSDTLAGDAKLVGLRLKYSLTSATG